MKLSIDSFSGEAPRVSPRKLPPNGAQKALNARLQSGDLESWRQFLLNKVLANTGGAVQTIYLLKDRWLSWTQQVDVARGLIPGDQSFLTFLTSPASLYTTPRFTTYALATSGAEPLPFATRPLGVPPPVTVPTVVVSPFATSTAFSVDITDDCSDLATNWQTSPGQTDGGGITSLAFQSSVVGNPQPSFQLTMENNQAIPAYFTRDFGIADTSISTLEVDVYIGNPSGNTGAVTNIMFGCDKTGAGCRITFHGEFFGAQAIRIGRGVDFIDDAGSSYAETVCTGTFTQGLWYHIKGSKTVNADNSSTVVAQLYDATGVTLLGTVTTTNFFENEGYCGALRAKSFDRLDLNYDNFHVKGSGSISLNVVNSATAYIYTFVNDLGWESAPSAASATILRPDGVGVTVTTPTAAPGDPTYGVVSKNIYRVVSGATGDIFLLVANVPLATATYLDTLDDAVISTPGNPLLSEDWDLPPPTLEGIIHLPNGCMAGFFRNQLCLSAAGFPFAWPIEFRNTTDTDIVAIANIDNTIVIGTKSNVYTCTGNDPATYTMSKPGEPQACVSKRSMIYLDGVGVMFASPDGYQVCGGSAGNVKNSTDTLFTKRQWQALDPASIRSAVHDGVLHFWFDGTTPDSGYALDTNSNGFGVISLGWHATAAYVDPLVDELYLVLDVVTEPTDGALPIASAAVAPSNVNIYEFDADPSHNMVYRWRGALNLVDYPTTMHFSKVEGGDYTNLIARFYADGALVYQKVITGNTEFRVPEKLANTSIEMELIGTSTVRSHQLTQDVTELS